MTSKIINLNCAVDQAVLTTSAAQTYKGNALDIKPVRGDICNIRFNCFSKLGDDQTFFPIPKRAGLEFIVAKKVAAAETDIMAYAYDAKFSPSLWTLFNRALGKIAVEVNFNSNRLDVALSDDASISLIAALVMVPSGTDFHITLCQFNITILNDIYRIGQVLPASIVLVPSALASSSSGSLTSSSSFSTSSQSSTSETSAKSSQSSSLSSQSSTSETSAHLATKSSSSSSTSTTSESTLSTTSISSTSESSPRDEDTSSHSMSTSSQSSTSESTVGLQSESSSSTVGKSTSSQSSSSSSSTINMSTSSTSVSESSSSSSSGQGGFNDPAIDDFDSTHVAAWKMEEASGIRTDSKGVNDLSETGSVGQVVGKSGNAADFPGTGSDILSKSDNADISPTSSLAISMWVYVDVFDPAAISLMDKVLSYDVYILSGQIFRARIRQSNGNYKNVVDTTSRSTATWYHLLFLAENGKLRLFTNGTETIGDSYNNTILDNQNSLRVGVGHDGRIDEAYLWKNISFADAAERNNFAAALYNSGTGKFYNAPP